MPPPLKDQTRIMYDTWPIDIMDGLFTSRARQRRIDYWNLKTVPNSYVHPAGVLKNALTMLKCSIDSLKFIMNNIEYAYYYKFTITKCNSYRMDLLPIGTRLPAQFYHIHCKCNENDPIFTTKRDLIMPSCVIMDFFDELLTVKDLQLYNVVINNSVLYVLELNEHIATSIYMRELAANKIQKLWKLHWQYIKKKHKTRLARCLIELECSPPMGDYFMGGSEYLKSFDDYNHLKTKLLL